MASPVLFILVMIVSVIASLLPALVDKWLMSAVFSRPTAYGLILIGKVLCTLIPGLGILAYLVASGQDPAAINLGPAASVAFTAAVFVVQTFLLAVLVPDREGFERIEVWKWAVVLILEFAIYVVLALAYAILVLNIL